MVLRLQVDTDAATSPTLKCELTEVSVRLTGSYTARTGEVVTGLSTLQLFVLHIVDSGQPQQSYIESLSSDL